MKKHIETLSDTYLPRDFYHHKNLDRVAWYIGDNFVSSRVSEQVFKVDGHNYRNVIAKFGPEHGSRIVVGAHYDAAGPHPGADDNASAIAVLIELSKTLSCTGELSCPVELVAFSLEEPPCFGGQYMGSAVHAHSLRESKVGVKLMVCLEMVGYFSDSPGSQQYPAPGMERLYGDVGNFIAVVGKTAHAKVVERAGQAMRAASDLPVVAIAAPSHMTGVGLSDHRNYWDRWPSVMITDTAFMRNPHYHQASDTSDTLDYIRMAEVVKGVAGVVLDNLKRKV